MRMRQGASGGALEGISTSIRALVPMMVTR